MSLEKEKLIEQDRFIRQPEVTLLTSVPKSSIPEEIKKGNFPKNATIMARSRVWLLSEIHAWMKERLKERDHDENMGENDESDL